MPRHQHYPVITAEEARGNSRPVSHHEFQSLAAQGADIMKSKAANAPGTGGIDSDWEGVKDRAYAATREPWGGTTVNAHSGQELSDSASEVEGKVAGKTGFGKGTYALTVRQPGQPEVSVHPAASRAQFGEAMDKARASYPQLAHEGGHLGVFHDEDKGSIDIDPTQIVHTPGEVEKIGAYSHAVGGAYHFQSGNGYFPPHVKSNPDQPW